MPKISKVHKRLSPAAAKLLQSKLRGIAMDSADNVRSLAKVGIHVSDFAAQSYAQAYGMDAAVSIPGLTVNASRVTVLTCNSCRRGCPASAGDHRRP